MYIYIFYSLQSVNHIRGRGTGLFRRMLQGRLHGWKKGGITK